MQAVIDIDGINYLASKSMWIQLANRYNNASSQIPIMIIISGDGTQPSSYT